LQNNNLPKETANILADWRGLRIIFQDNENAKKSCLAGLLYEQDYKKLKRLLLKNKLKLKI